MAATQESIGTRTTCPQCNTPIKAGARFCPVCGASIPGQPAQPAAAPQAAFAAPKSKAALGGKWKLVIIAAVLILIFVVISKLNSPINRVKNSTLNDFGSQTIGEMVDDNFKKVKWSYEKLDSSSGFVYAEGYCVTFQENMGLEFYYDKSSGELSLTEIDWLDSNEADTNLFSMALTVGILYG